MALHVALQQLGGLETLATVLTRMRLAVDLLRVPLHHPFVRAGVVTLLLMITFMYLDPNF